MRPNEIRALLGALQECRDALESVRAVVNMTDPEHDTFADSGADAIEALCLIDIDGALARCAGELEHHCAPPASKPGQRALEL